MKKSLLAIAIAAVVIAGGYFAYSGYLRYMNSYEGGGDYCLINEKGEVVSDIRFVGGRFYADADLGGPIVILRNRWPRENRRYKEAYALLDSNGNIVLGPSESRITSLDQGLFQINQYIYDSTGTKVGTLQEWGDLGMFGKNGLAPLEYTYSNFRVGYIDATGKYVIEREVYDDTGKLAPERGLLMGETFADNGLAAVENHERLWGYIDATGNYVIKPQFEGAGTFSEGLAVVKISDGNMAYIRENGEIAFEIKCKSAGKFLNGRAVITGDNEKKYLINTDGTRISNEEYDYIFNSSNSDILLAINDDRYCFIGIDGKPAFDKTFDLAEDFSRNGLCAVCDENGLWGYIGTDGEWVIEPVFERAYPFDSTGGVAIVMLAEQPN